MSAVWCVLPALKAAIATGIVDAGRVGLQGHSWGGYQTSFLVTQTSAFRAAVAGAPLTNMVSMYSLIYKNTGGGNMAIFESSQGRFKGGYWDNWEAYVRNSPVAHATRVTTPLLLLHNDKDGAVDFTQGIEYYNTLRRLKKPVVLLQYVGENHGLRKPANQQDYTVRMKEFFDHHLKGAPAPQWWTDGVPRLEIEQHLRERKEQARPRPAPRPTPTAGQS
jgi:dipeptidyl aminopeptidase/acylaminoacyl peptidase